MAKKPTKTCDCIGKVNAALEEYNTQLDLAFNTAGKVAVTVATVRINTLRDGKKAKTVIAAFCPFCGIKLDF